MYKAKLVMYTKDLKSNSSYNPYKVNDILVASNYIVNTTTLEIIHGVYDKYTRVIGGKRIDLGATQPKSYYEHEDGIAFTTNDVIEGVNVIQPGKHYWYDFNQRKFYQFNTQVYYYSPSYPPSSSICITIENRKLYINDVGIKTSKILGVSGKYMYYMHGNYVFYMNLKKSKESEMIVSGGRIMTVGGDSILIHHGPSKKSVKVEGDILPHTKKYVYVSHQGNLSVYNYYSKIETVICGFNPISDRIYITGRQAHVFSGRNNWAFSFNGYTTTNSSSSGDLSVYEW